MPESSRLFLRCFQSPALISQNSSGNETVVLGIGKPLLILACLEAHPGGVSRETLASIGWGNRNDQQARGSLRQSLLRLRQLIGPESVTLGDEHVTLTIQLASDRSSFLHAIAAGDDLAACATYHGTFLDGVPIPDTDELSHWATIERDRLAVLWRDAALSLVRSQLNQGHHTAAEALAADVTKSFPGSIAGWTARLDASRGIGGAAHRHALAELEVLLTGDTFGSIDSAEAARLHRRYSQSLNATGVPARSGLSLPLVGRESLIRRLEEFAKGPVENDTPRIVVLEGSAGMGKTRILHDLCARIANRAVPPVVVSAVASERRTRWTFLNRLIRALSDLPGSTGIESGSAQVLVHLDPALAERFPATRNSGADAPDDNGIVTAVVDLLDAVQTEGPLTVILDDIHLGDTPSMQVIASALNQGESRGRCVIAASRPWHRNAPGAWTRWQMTPLDHGDLQNFSQRLLPRLPAALHPSVAEQLLLVTGGVPLYLRFAVRQMIDSGLIRHDAGSFAADEADTLVASISHLSLQRDPLFPTLTIEQTVLGYLEIAEEPVSQVELAEVIAVTHPQDVQEVLERLAQAGWLHFDQAEGGDATLAHAIVADEVRNAIRPERRAQLQRLRAEWLVRHGTTLGQLQGAVRLFSEVGAASRAVNAVRQWRRRTGSRVTGLSDLIEASHTTVLFRWRLRLAASPWDRGLVLVLIALVAAAGGWMYWLGRPGQLSLENQPVVEAVSPNRRASSNIDPPRLTVRDRRGRITRSLDGELLTMESIIGADSAFLRGEPRVHDGLVEATSIDLWLPENFDSVAVRFRVGALRSAPVVVNRGWSHFLLRLASGSLAGQVVASPNPTIHVARGSPIEGQLVFRYITPSRAATYMLGESSTFNDYRTDTTTLISLLPGALNAAVTVRVSRTAPLVAGTYWLAWALAAETNAQSIWSSTNWACGPGVWDDGNDILANPDALRRLPDWSGGQLNISKLSCPEGLPPKFGSDRLRIAAVQVIVDP